MIQQTLTHASFYKSLIPDSNFPEEPFGGYADMGKTMFRLNFTYYINPEPNSRNMEFNTKSNLFKNLSSLEQVSAP
jgi:hypothetical protein